MSLPESPPVEGRDATASRHRFALLLRVAASPRLPTFVRNTAERVTNSSVAYRLAHGTFWSLVGAVVSRLAGLAAAVVTARLLGLQDFGKLGVINGTVAMFQVFGGLGLGVTGTTYVAQFRERDGAKVSRVLALSSVVSWVSGGVAAAVVILLAPWIAGSVLHAPELTPLLRISSCTLLLSAINGAQTGVLAGFEAFRALTRVNLVTGIASFAIVVVAVWSSGLEGAVWAMAAAAAVQCALCHWAIRREARLSGLAVDYRSWTREWRVLLAFSLPAAAAGLMVAPVTWACSALLVNQPNGWVSMGVFNAANQWFGAVLFLPTIAGSAMLPVLAERVSAGDRGAQAKLLKASMALNAAVVVPAVTVLCVMSPALMRMYGASVDGAALTLVAVAVTAGVLAVVSPIGQLLVASGRLWTGFAMNGGWGALFFAGSWLLVSWGALGLAVARLMAYIVHSVWTFAFAARLLRRSPDRSLP